MFLDNLADIFFSDSFSVDRVRQYAEMKYHAYRPEEMQINMGDGEAEILFFSKDLQEKYKARAFRNAKGKWEETLEEAPEEFLEENE